jgi:hypothetical protein
MPDLCLRTLCLAFDTSGICVSEEGTQIINRTHKKQIEVIRIPLRDEVDGRVALARARQIVDTTFDLAEREVARTSKSEETDKVPHRVHAATRNAGIAGARA